MGFDNKEEFTAAVRYAERVNELLEILHGHFPTNSPDQLMFQANIEPDGDSRRGGVGFRNFGATPEDAKAFGEIIVCVNNENFPGINSFSPLQLQAMRANLENALLPLFKGNGDGQAVHVAVMPSFADEGMRQCGITLFINTRFLNDGIVNAFDQLPRLIDTSIQGELFDDYGLPPMHFSAVEFPHYHLNNMDELVLKAVDVENELGKYSQHQAADVLVANEADIWGNALGDVNLDDF
ncbi:hypothetical protein GC177_08615 [bacterium]|nr:hypothetical protein [bacterium]